MSAPIKPGELKPHRGRVATGKGSVTLQRRDSRFKHESLAAALANFGKPPLAKA